MAFTLDSEKVEKFLSTNKSTIFCSLIYGYDEGAVTIISKKIISIFFPNKNDKINGLERINYKELINNPSILYDFFCSHSLFAEKKLLVVADCSENITQEILHTLQKNSSATNHAVVFIGGELKKNSKIVKCLEKIQNCLIVPCYKPDHQSISNIMRNWFTENKLQYDNNLLNRLKVIMPANRLLIEHELEKLAIYCAYKKITSEAIEEFFSDYSQESSLEALSAAFFKNNKKNFLLEMSNILEKNYSSILIIRSLQNYVTRLKQVKELMKKAISLPEALSSLTPPLFFKDKDNFLEILKTKSLEELNNILYNLLLTESSIKKDTMHNKDIHFTQILYELLG